MTSLIPRAGTSLLMRRKLIISRHLLSHRCDFGGTTYCHQSNEKYLSRHFYIVERKHHSTTHHTSDKLQQKILLPRHGQNGTLLLRSSSKCIGQVDIIPQWRDDTMLELVPIVVPEAENDGDAHATSDNCGVKEVQYDDELPSTEEQQIVSHGGLQFTLHRDGIATALRRKGSLVEVDVDIDGDSIGGGNEQVLTSVSQWWKLVATVPEKFNITCNVAKGDINVISKLEGDSHLETADGNIKVSKLRGHDVTLSNKCTDKITSGDDTSSPGLIYVQKGIEAQTVRISSSNRVRARMVNGSDVSVQVVGSQTYANEESVIDDTVNDEESDSKLDEDDAGFKIDIGSLYISGSSECEARLDVDEVDSSTGLVRVKSSHGHVTVHARAKKNASMAKVEHQTNPFVDLGGVNGSCDVTLEVECDSTDVNVATHTTQEAPVTTRVHFDSLSPDSISTISSSHLRETSYEGIVSVTVDRKVEADLRLLAIRNGQEPMPIDMDRLTSDELDDVESSLLDIKRYNENSGLSIKAKPAESILIETEAFDTNSYDKTLPKSECFQYKQGTIRNKSGEPDSRFDIRSSPSRGKINIDSAASQALSGFQGKKNESDSPAEDNAHVPLLVVATNGKIKVETLSWLGAIARRYGLEEGEQDLGRTASRRPRLS